MIITSKTATKAIKSGNASIVGITNHNEERFIIIERYDHQRTDHVVLDSCPKWMQEKAEAI